MKIVILGAGASFDSINKFHEPNNADVLKWKPPLGNDIFGSRSNFREIYNKYPGSSNLSHAISASTDIEEYFQQKWDLAIKHQDKYTLANIISVQYCLQELFYTISENYSNDIGSSNYHILVQQAYDYHLATGEDVVFITFNYDLLLEYAVLSFFNESVEIKEDLYTKYPIKIFKPHGACNWFKVSYKYSLNSLLNVKPNLKEIQDNLEGEIIVSVHPLKKINTSYGNNTIFNFGQNQSNGNKIKYSFPQILIPIKSKDEFVMTKEHTDLMEDYLSKCKEMLIIGWKGQEEFFLEKLKEHCGKNKIQATFVTCKDNTTFKELNNVIPNMTPSFFIDKHIESYTKKDEGTVSFEHTEGSFSAYILNIAKGKFDSFFNIP